MAKRTDAGAAASQRANSARIASIGIEPPAPGTSTIHAMNERAIMTRRAAAKASRRAMIAEWRRGTVVAASAGLACLAVVVASERLFGWLGWGDSTWVITGGLLALGVPVVAGGAWAATRRWSIERAASRLDSVFALKDRMRSAIELADREPGSAVTAHDGVFAELAVRDAERVSAELRIESIVPGVWRGAWATLAAGAVVAVAAWFMPQSTSERASEALDSAAGRESTAAVIEAAADLAREALERNEVDAARDVDAKRQLAELDEITRELASPGTAATPREALARSARAVEDVADRLDAEGEREQRRVDEARRALASAARKSAVGSAGPPSSGSGQGENDAPGTDSSPADEFSRALQEGDLDAARRAAERLADNVDGLRPEQRERLAGELDRMAREMREESRTSAASGRDSTIPQSGQASSGEPAAGEDASGDRRAEEAGSKGQDRSADRPVGAADPVERQRSSSDNRESGAAASESSKTGRVDSDESKSDSGKSQTGAPSATPPEREPEAKGDSEWREPESGGSTGESKGQSAQARDRSADRESSGDRSRADDGSRSSDQPNADGRSKPADGRNPQGQPSASDDRSTPEPREGAGERSSPGGERSRLEESLRRASEAVRREPRDRASEPKPTGSKPSDGTRTPPQRPDDRGEKNSDRGASGDAADPDPSRASGTPDDKRREAGREASSKQRGNGSEAPDSTVEGEKPPPGASSPNEPGTPRDPQSGSNNREGESPPDAEKPATSSDRQRPTDRPGRAEPSPTGASDEPDGRPQSDGEPGLPESMSREAMKRLAKELRELQDRSDRAARDRRSAEDLRREAEELLKRASPEQRRTMEELAREMQRQGADGEAGDRPGEEGGVRGGGPSDKRDAGDPLGREAGGDRPGGIGGPAGAGRRAKSDQGVVPSDGDWSEDSRGLDASDGAASERGTSASGVRPIAEIPKIVGDAPVLRSTSGITRGAVREAAKGAERALEQQTVPPQHSDLIRRVYRRILDRTSSERGSADAARDRARTDGSVPDAVDAPDAPKK
jgi:hypothetical protein